MTKLMQDVSIGNNIQKCRKARGLTQEQVCAQMTILQRPISQSHYAQIELGQKNIFVSDLIVLSRIFKVDFNTFFENIEPLGKTDKS